ncbi:MAG TPA: phospholipid carrier-dependent glycosyltransferase, partial [Nocardioides sp.]|nr:phospholipid carrier-dependent glycosyltransferase [Nocardioides sp.]
MTTAPTLEQESLSSDVAGRRLPTAWERARKRVDLEDPVVGWTASLGLTLLSLFLRLWKLGTPKLFEF